MKYYLPAAMILTATAPVASAEATISLGYCMLCADWNEKKHKKEASVTFQKNTPTITPVITSSNATFRSEFIPWPTKAMLQRTSPPISRELTHFFDFSAPLTEPLATITKQRSVSSNRHKSTSQKRSKFDVPKQQQQHQQQNEEEPFFPLFFLVAASLLAFNVIAAAAEFIFRYAEKEEKEDKISSDEKEEDFGCLGLAPTVEDEEDEEQQEEDVSVCKVDTIEIKRQDEMSRDKTLEKDSSVPQQEQDCTVVSASSVDNCLGYTCTNTFEDKVSVEILKFLLEDRVEKYDKANVVMVEEEEEVCQDKADNSSSAITTVSDEVDTIIAPPPKKKSVVGPWWDLFSHCNAAVDDESDDEQSMKSVLL